MLSVDCVAASPQIYWSKRRRAVFYIFSLIVFCVSLATVGYFSLHISTHVLPEPTRGIFLGYNFLYNTQVCFLCILPWMLVSLMYVQALGPLTAPGWLGQQLWRSFWFYIQLIYSIRILYLRAYNIKHHERDIGTWLPKDTQMLRYKLGRLLFLLPVVVILLTDVMPRTNPRIINSAFYQECTLQPTFKIGLESTFAIGACTLSLPSESTGPC